MSHSNIYETADFEIVVEECQLEGPWKGQQGYRIYNMRTNVCEVECGGEVTAIQYCRASQERMDEMQKVLDEQLDGEFLSDVDRIKKHLDLDAQSEQPNA